MIPDKNVSEAKMRELAKKNPDLTYEFIKKILIAQQETAAGKLSTYVFDEK